MAQHVAPEVCAPPLGNRCSNQLANPSGSIFRICPESDHFSAYPLLAVWCKLSPSLPWVPATASLCFSLLPPSNPYSPFANKSLQRPSDLHHHSCLIQPHHSDRFYSHTFCLAHSGLLADPQTSQAHITFSLSLPYANTVTSFKSAHMSPPHSDLL